jgi:hypothetical protein
VFWQWVNQSFNALVNYTNRNAKSPTTTTQLGVAYVSATASAMITALGCKAVWQKRASPLLQVPDVFCRQYDFIIIAFCMTNFHKLVPVLGDFFDRFPEIGPKPTNHLAGPCVNRIPPHTSFLSRSPRTEKCRNHHMHLELDILWHLFLIICLSVAALLHREPHLPDLL